MTKPIFSKVAMGGTGCLVLPVRHELKEKKAIRCYWSKQDGAPNRSSDESTR